MYFIHFIHSCENKKENNALTHLLSPVILEKFKQ